MANSPVVDGPIGIVGAGYIGHLFAQQFALAGYDVRAWSPGMSAHTLRDRLQRSVSTLVDIGAVEPTAVDKVLAGSPHTTTSPPRCTLRCRDESIVEDAQAKSACYRNIEAAIGADVLVWSSTSNFPMSRLAADMAHPERAIVVHPVQTQLIIFVEVVAGEKTSDATVTTTMRFCEDVDLERSGCARRSPGSSGTGYGSRCCARCSTWWTSEPSIRSSSTRRPDHAACFVPVFGPLQMTDLIGHDTLRDISNALYPDLATDRTASRTIEQHVADGRLGVKSGRGFYDDNDQRVADLANKLCRIARQLDSDFLDAVGDIPHPELHLAVECGQCLLWVTSRNALHAK